MISAGGWLSSVGRIQGASFFFFVLYFFFNPVYSATNPNYTACALQTCDRITIRYPFSLSSQSGSGCGYPGLSLVCLDNNQTLLLQTPTLNFTVSGIDYSAHTIHVAIDPKYMVGTPNCPYPWKNITLQDITGAIDPLPLNFTNGATTEVTFFYNCTTPPSSGSPGSYLDGGGAGYDFTEKVVPSCSAAAWRSYAFFGSDSPGTVSMSCQSSFLFPVSASSTVKNLMSSLNDGFSINWTVDSATSDCGSCSTSGGRCGSDSVTGSFVCYCQDDTHKATCNNSGNVRKIKVIAGLSAAVASFLLACLLFFITRSLWFSSSRMSPAENGCFQLHTPTKVEKFLIDYETLTTTRYTYNDIMRMTHKFKYKLGQGGYGSVFKGWLSNGTPVAVKLMEKSYNDGEEFCNEVASIGRIHHVNVVRLLGFCVEGSRRALVYDFMENGSLEKFTEATTAGRCLLRERLYDIALGIARGIEYLHQGCDQRIIHFDIKPHNVLLDHDFTPKISDFGLAKSYCKERNSVTLTAGKGTIGYIAPEIFYGNSKHVSHKADVYSFGMLLIAMIGMKEKFGPTDGASSEVYFPHWIHATLSKNRKFEGIGEGQDEIIRKIASIALWCIQWNPIDRPCMKQVVRMFESSTSSLTMPPNHFFPAVEPEHMLQVVDFSSTSECSGLLV